MSLPNATHLSPIPEAWQALSYAVLSDGSLIIVVTDVDLASERARVFGNFGVLEPPSQINELKNSGRVQLLVWAADGWRSGPTFPLENSHLLVDRFGDGRWLVVGTRTLGEPNARVFAPDGSQLARFTLGDGIEHVAIDSFDRIWVGWFDEGVGGNTGWQVPGQEWPPSSNGVACFASDGRLIDVPSKPAGVEHIEDCYALTVDGAGVWVCTYTDFPLIRFSPGGSARWWCGAPAGSKAIAVDGDRALVAGGYGADAARLALLRLDGAGEGEGVQLLATSHLPLRPAAPTDHRWAPVWERPNLLAGRGDTLHLVDDDIWYRWRVADAIAALGQP
jgi:hypothetical protein